MGLLLLEGPAAPVVSLAEAQAHVRSENAEESALLSSMVDAATAQAEAYCRRRFVTQRWRATLDRFPDGALILPHPPLASVEAVTYADTGGTVQTLTPTEYVVRKAETPGEVIPAHGTSWPSAREVPDAVGVDFTCGYGDPAEVPHAIKQAVLLLVGSLYRDRENASPVALTHVPTNAEWLLGPFVVRRFAA